MEKLKTKYISLGDARIAYREHGSGPTLILLHGNSESKRAFSRYQKVHFNMFRTIAIDSRGHGETISNDTKYSIGQYSQDVIALCNAKGINQAYVIGYSDGGNIALFLATKRPDIFTKIVAISPNYLVNGTTDGWLMFFKSMGKILRFLGRVGLPTKKAIMRFDLMLNDIGITAKELGNIRTNLAYPVDCQAIMGSLYIGRVAGTLEAFRPACPSSSAFFPDETACEAYLERQRWPYGFVYPKCSCRGEPYRFS